jgi:hypothetical protein
VVGVVSLVFPEQVGAVGSVWAVTAMVWGLAVITVAHTEREAPGARRSGNGCGEQEALHPFDTPAPP